VQEPKPYKRPTRRIPPLDADNAQDALEHDHGKAAREAIAYADGNLDRESKKNEHDRSEALRDTIHILFGYGLKGAFILYGLALVSVCWHYLMPENYGWLSTSQLHTVTTVVFSGAVTSRGGQYLSRRVR